MTVTDIMTMTRADMARLLSVSLSALDRACRDNPPGCIRRGKGIGTTFDAPTFLRWWIGRQAGDGDDFAAQRTRKTKLEADRLEIELARAAGDLLDREAVERGLARAAAELRVQLWNLAPQRIARRLYGETLDRAAIAEAVRQELRPAMEAFAAVDVTGASDEADVDPLEALAGELEAEAAD